MRIRPGRTRAPDHPDRVRPRHPSAPHQPRRASDWLAPIACAAAPWRWLPGGRAPRPRGIRRGRAAVGGTVGWASAAAPPQWIAVSAVAVAVQALAPPGVRRSWAAPAVAGAVVGERALVSPDDASVDLVTGKTVRLGSVTGGRRLVADDRMIVVSEGRVVGSIHRSVDVATRPSSRRPRSPPHGSRRSCGCAPTERPETCSSSASTRHGRAGLGHGRARPERRHHTSAPARTDPLPRSPPCEAARARRRLPRRPRHRAAHDRPGQSVLPVPAGRPLAVTVRRRPLVTGPLSLDLAAGPGPPMTTSPARPRGRD